MEVGDHREKGRVRGKTGNDEKREGERELL